MTHPSSGSPLQEPRQTAERIEKSLIEAGFPWLTILEDDGAFHVAVAVRSGPIAEDDMQRRVAERLLGWSQAFENAAEHVLHRS